MDMAPLAAIEGPALADVNPVLACWLESTLSCLRAWLASALELDSRSYEAVVDTLLRVPGRVFATATHVDLVTTLEQARPRVRRAALDLDPGWLPAYGRVVQFHFR